MDIQREKPKGWRAIVRKKNIPYALAAVFAVFVLWLIFRNDVSTLRVNASTVTIATAHQIHNARLYTLVGLAVYYRVDN